MKPLPGHLIAYGCLALSMALTGSYVALSKPLVAALPVFLLSWMRFGIAAIAMLPWLRKPADEAPLTAQTRRLLFLESFVGNFLFSICMLYGVSMTSAVSAGVILAGIPAVIALMSWLFLGERISRRMWAAACCAVLGLVVLALARADFFAARSAAHTPTPQLASGAKPSSTRPSQSPSIPSQVVSSASICGPSSRTSRTGLTHPT